MSPRYVIITPVRDEEAYIERTIVSVAQQSVMPARWIVVDDGSTDRTGEILDAAARQYPWMRVVHRSNRGFRKSGGGVIEAFYDGLATLDVQEWEFLVKLDGDLSFEPSYFARCFEEFSRNPKLGLTGGTVCASVNGKTVVESKGDPRFHVRGATKIYRQACWTAIGGLMRSAGWDTVDEVAANMLGWETYTLPQVICIQHKSTGSSDGIWRTWVKNGVANYVTGYHPLFMVLKCVRRSLQPPYGVLGVALAWGFLKGYCRRIPRVADTRVIQYVRQQQMNKLLFRPSLW